ncbi:MAG: hypothetical protein AB1489_37465, partial [Acidobacteriota bacterium]
QGDQGDRTDQPDQENGSNHQNQQRDRATVTSSDIDVEAEIIRAVKASYNGANQTAFHSEPLVNEGKEQAQSSSQSTKNVVVNSAETMSERIDSADEANQPNSDEESAKARSNAKSGNHEADKETGYRAGKNYHSQQSVRRSYSDSPKTKPLSRFSLDDCLEFARAEAKHNPNITNPIGLSKWQWQTGEQDHLIQAWKDNPEEMVAIWESGVGFSACDRRTGSQQKGSTRSGRSNKPPTHVGAQQGVFDPAQFPTLNHMGSYDPKCEHCCGFGFRHEGGLISDRTVECDCWRRVTKH